MVRASWLRRAVAAPLRILIPKNPWLRALVILVPILLLLALFEPVLNLLVKGVSTLFAVFEPLLDNPGGRLILLNLLLLVLIWIAWVMWRGHVRQTRSGLVLSKHLDGIKALLHGEARRARELFAAVARYRGPMPAEYDCLIEDSRLKLARLDLQAGDAEAALGWLGPIRDHKLPKELRRSFLQQRIDAYLQLGEHLPQTLRQELEAALQSFPDDRRLLTLRRRIAVAEGDLHTAVAVQERALKHAAAGENDQVRQVLLDDYDALAAELLAKGALDDVWSLSKRALRLQPNHTPALMARGDVLLARGQARKAMRVWGASRSPEGLQRMAELLNQQQDLLEARELLECSPTHGGLLLVARQLARNGQCEQAIRAARRAASGLELSPTVALLLQEVLRQCGQTADAKALVESADWHRLAPSKS